MRLVTFLDVVVVGVEDGGTGENVPPQNSGKIFFGQLLCKIRAFSGKNRVKFGNFVNFSEKYINSGILLIFHIFLAKMSCPLNLTELLRLCVYLPTSIHPSNFFTFLFEH